MEWTKSGRLLHLGGRWRCNSGRSAREPHRHGPRQDKHGSAFSPDAAFSSCRPCAEVVSIGPSRNGVAQSRRTAGCAAGWCCRSSTCGYTVAFLGCPTINNEFEYLTIITAFCGGDSFIVSGSGYGSDVVPKEGENISARRMNALWQAFSLFDLVDSGFQPPFVLLWKLRYVKAVRCCAML
jgi:hypothetical protein